jgi:anti-anti-sigma factor
MAVTMDGSLPHSSGVVTLSGELDAAGYRTVRTALTAALTAGGLGDDAEIVVDLRAVRFMDAGTVGLLLEAWRSALDGGHHLRVTGVGDAVRRVIQASGAGYRLLGPATEETGPATEETGPTKDTGPASEETGPTTNAGLITTASANRRRATTERHRAEVEQTRIVARLQQQAIDGELRATRRILLADLRERLRADPRALAGAEFLAVADTAAVLDAIVLAATVVGAADACDLQLYDPHTATLSVARQRGFTRECLAHLAAARPSASATAATTGAPVLIDDIATSPIFAGQPTLDVMLAAGSRAVHAHPLHDGAGQLLGVLSFHYRAARPRRGDRELVAWAAARALARTAST